MQSKPLLLGIIFLIVTPIVMGIGIRPGIVQMNLIPGFERTFDFWITNTMNQPIGVDIRPYYESEAFQDTFTLSVNRLELEPLQTKKIFVTLKLPEDIVAPGL